MLTYLINIASKVYDFFDNLFSYTKTLATTAYSSLTDYHWFHASSVKDYTWQRRHHVQHYSDYARGPTDDIAVYNYVKSRFVAVDSYSDVATYRWYLRDALTDYKWTKQHVATHVLNVRQANTYTVVDTPVSDLWYINRRGPRVVQDWEYWRKPDFLELQWRKYRIINNADEPVYSRVDLLARHKFYHLLDYTDRLHPPLSEIAGKNAQLQHLTAQTVFSRLSHLSGPDYSNVQSLTGRTASLMRLSEPQNLGRALRLLENDYDTLDKLLSDATKFIIEQLGDDFFEWFFTALWKWLTDT